MGASMFRLKILMGLTMKYITRLLTIGALLLSFSSVAQEPYYPIVPPQSAKDIGAGKIEVIEFFWYGCSHCYNFEPALKAWLKDKPSNVVFRRVPAIFRKSMLIHAKAYLTAEMLGITEKVHPVIFDTIHKGKRALDTTQEISKLMADTSGLPLQDVIDTMNSFAIESQARQAIQMSRLYGLRGVPSMAVDGKVMVTGRTAGSLDAIPGVVDDLIKQIAAQ